MPRVTGTITGVYGHQRVVCEKVCFCFVCYRFTYRQRRIKTKHTSDETEGTNGQLKKTLAAKELIYSGACKYKGIMVKLGEKNREGSIVTF